jgi:hypothetical protein
MGVVMAFAMLVNTACYAFVPAAQGVSPKAGQQVRVKLSPAGTESLTQFLGPRVEYADGVISEMRPDGSFVVGVDQIRLLDGVDRFWSGISVVTFAPAQVAEVQIRTLDRSKTRIATIAAVVATLAIFAIAIGLGGAHGDDTGTIQPPP